MNQNKTKSIIFLAMLTLALFIGVILVRQNQDTRRGAYFAQTALLLKPDTFNVSVGDAVPVEVWVVSDSDAKIDGVQPYVCFGSELALAGSNVLTSIEPNADTTFNTTTMAVVDEATGCVKFQVSSVGTATGDLPSGAFKAATLNLVAEFEGSGTIDIGMDKSKVSGRNTDLSSKDTAVAITSVEGANYTVGEGDGPTGDGVWANYRVAFIGVRPANKCAVNWQTKLVALSGNTTKEYTNIPLNRTSDVNDKGEVIFEGSRELNGFTAENNVALFFKGPKHLQVKYGEQGQNELYNQSGGQLSLSTGPGSTVYDFSNYPMLAGDVDGSGVVDGIDFTLVKTKATAFEEVSEGSFLLEDLDGSCQVNNIDVRLLIESLNEKQDQIY